MATQQQLRSKSISQTAQKDIRSRTYQGQVQAKERLVDAGKVENQRLSQARNLKEYSELYGDVPRELKRYVKGLDKVEAEQESRIDNIENEILRIQKERDQRISDLRKKEREAQSRGDSDRADTLDDRADALQSYYRGVVKGLNEGKVKLETGEFVDPNNIKKYSRELGSALRNKTEDKQDFKEAMKRKGLKKVQGVGYVDPKALGIEVKGQLTKAKLKEAGFTIQGKNIYKTVKVPSNKDNLMTTREGVMRESDVYQKKYISSIKSGEKQDGSNVSNRVLSRNNLLLDNKPNNNNSSRSANIEKGFEASKEKYKPIPNQINMPPTLKTQVDEKGLIGGTFSYLGEKAYSKSLKIQFKRDQKNSNYELYQPFATARLSSFTATTLPYLNPLGAGIMIAKGVEQVATKKGQANLKLEQTRMQNEGRGKTGSIALSYVNPALEIGLGAYGVKQQIGAYRSNLPVKTNFIATAEQKELGTEVKVLTQSRQGGKPIQETISREIIVGDGKVLAELNKGFKVNPVKKGYQITEYQGGGLVRETGASYSEQYAKSLNDVFSKTSVNIPNSNSAVSKTISKEVGGFKIIRTKGGTTRENIKLDNQINRGSFLGSAQETKIGDLVVGGSPKLRIYKYGEVKLATKTDTQGIILKQLPEKEQIEFIKFNINKKTPLAETFKLEPKLSTQPKTKPNEIIKPTNNGMSLVLKNEPLIKTGATQKEIQQSVFRQLGQVKANLPKDSSIIANDLYKTGAGLVFLETKNKSSVQELIKPKEKELVKTAPRFKEESREFQKPKLRQESILIQSPKQKYRQPQLERTKQQVKQKEQQKQSSSLIQLLKTKTRTSPFSRSIQISRSKEQEIKPLPPIPKTSSLLKRLSNRAQESKSFEVFGKRFGKDISLGTFSSQKGAKKELIKFLKGTLGRSGFIEREGKKLSFDELILSDEFRKAKKDQTRVVQKAKFSLGTGSEISEIQYFKKKNNKSQSKKNKRKNLFGI